VGELRNTPDGPLPVRQRLTDLAAVERDQQRPGGGDRGHQWRWPVYVILQRINLGLFAILGELSATADWRTIAEEIWPFVQGPPSTPMGEAEVAWRAGRGRPGRPTVTENLA
jgi:hypothetical protein